MDTSVVIWPVDVLVVWAIVRLPISSYAHLMIYILFCSEIQTAQAVEAHRVQLIDKLKQENEALQSQLYETV